MTKTMFWLFSARMAGSGLQLVLYSAFATLCLALAVTGCAGPDDEPPQKSPHAALWEIHRRAEKVREEALKREQGMKPGAAESPAGTEASSPASPRGTSRKNDVAAGGES